MKFGRFILEVTIAGILYWSFPEGANHISIIGFMLLYLFQVISIIRGQRYEKSFLSFNVLFFTMLTLVTYLIPLLYLLDLDSFIVSIILYDTKYIPKSLFLTSIAVSFYGLGFQKGEFISYNKGCNSLVVGLTSLLKRSKVWVLIATVVFFISYSATLALGLKDIPGLIVTFINCIFIFALIITGYSNKELKLRLIPFFKRHLTIYICTAIIIVSMLALGDRYTPICLAVTSLFVINKFVHRFSILQFLLIIIAGFVVLVGVSLTRNTSDKKEALNQEDNVVVYFQDVVPINLDFYLGLEWKDKNGLYKPGRIFQILVYPIPFAPTIVQNLFFDGEELASGRVLTDYNKNNNPAEHSNAGVGTHAILDIYMSWGILGIMFFFYWFGRLVGLSGKRSDNIYYLLIYGAFVSRAIYIPRETIFVPYRDIVYILLIAALIIHTKTKTDGQRRLGN